MTATIFLLSIVIVSFGLGLSIGIVMKGINININSPRQEQQSVQPVQTEDHAYNKSTADILPPEIKDYYLKTKGFTE